MYQEYIGYLIIFFHVCQRPAKMFSWKGYWGHTLTIWLKKNANFVGAHVCYNGTISHVLMVFNEKQACLCYIVISLLIYLPLVQLCPEPTRMCEYESDGYGSVLGSKWVKWVDKFPLKMGLKFVPSLNLGGFFGPLDMGLFQSFALVCVTNITLEIDGLNVINVNFGHL